MEANLAFVKPIEGNNRKGKTAEHKRHASKTARENNLMQDYYSTLLFIVYAWCFASLYRSHIKGPGFTVYHINQSLEIK